MPIAVFCRKCDQRYQVKDEFAGKKIRCPDCQNVIEVGTRTNDGIEVLDEDEEEEYGDQPRALPERRRRRSREERLTKRSRVRTGSGDGSWGWVLGGVGVAGLFGVALIGFLFPWVMFILAFVLLFTGAAAAAVGGIGCIVKAFQEDVACGLMYLFVPFYGIYYIFTRWDDIQPFGFCVLGGAGTEIVALVLMFAGFALTAAGTSRPGALAGGPNFAQAQPPQFQMPPPAVNFPQPVHQPAPEFPQPDFAPPNFPAPRAMPNFPQQDARQKSYLNRTQAEIRTILAPRGHEFAVGDTVYLEWGANWYECEVLEVNSAGHPKVHWIGWSSSWDEYFTPDKIRIARKKKSQD